MRCQSRVVTAAVIACAAGWARADTAFYVRATGSDNADGRSKETAFRTIQRAITRCTSAGEGYTIYVGPGTYNETLSIGTGTGTAAQHGTAAKPNRVIGDTTGAFTGDAPGAVTIEGGSARDYGINLNGRNYWRFDRLTVKGQRICNVMWQNATGGGVHSSSLHVPSGSAAYAVYGYRAGDLTIQGNRLPRTATSGHGIYVNADNRAGFVRIDANTFGLTGPLYLSRNYAAGVLAGTLSVSTVTQTWSYGIVAMVGNGTSVRSSAEITNNAGSDCMLGIGAYTHGPQTSAVIANNTVTGCFYPLMAYAHQTGRISIVNNITTDSAYSYLAYRDGSPNTGMPSVVVKGLLQHNIRHTNPWGNLNVAATGLVTGDPRFTDPANGDFSLRAGSPARDAGYADAAPTTDVRGRARPADENRDGAAAFDLGAWEGGTRRNLRVLSWWEASEDSDSNGQAADRSRPERAPATGKKLTDPVVRGLAERLSRSPEKDDD